MCGCVQGLLTRLKGLDDVVVTHGVRLIVVDSIACLARKVRCRRCAGQALWPLLSGCAHSLQDFGPTELQERQMLLSETAAALKYLAETFNLPVVVTNQVCASRSLSFSGRCTPCFDAVAQVLSSGVSTSAALGDVCIEDGMVLPALGTLYVMVLSITRCHAVMNADVARSGGRTASTRVSRWRWCARTVATTTTQRARRVDCASPSRRWHRPLAWGSASGQQACAPNSLVQEIMMHL